MKAIKYIFCDYKNPETCHILKQRYFDWFHYDIGNEFSFWYGENPFGSPIGFLAIDQCTGEIVGHSGAIQICALLEGKPVKGRISLGTMVSPEFRGYGIATEIGERLLSVMKNAGEDRFILGFPNENSIKIFKERLGYQWIRDYHFVTLPKNGGNKVKFSLCQEKNFPMMNIRNRTELFRPSEFCLWRYHDEKYQMYQSENGNIFICTSFQDKMDILCWSPKVDESELLSFATFLYKTKAIERVCTWNTFSWLENYPKDERAYHFCIYTFDKLKNSPLNESWDFFMGDCELF